MKTRSAEKKAVESKKTDEQQLSELDPAQWVELYGDDLFRYASYHTRTREQAEELVQETFLSALKAIDRFEGRSSIKTWLRTILRNKLIDSVRKSGREQKVIDSSVDFTERNDYFGPLGIWKTTLPSWGKNPEDALNDKGLLEALQACIQKLPERNRQVLVMRTIDGENIQEICKIMDISTSNCSVLLYRARMLLRTCIEKKWFKA